MKTKFLFCATLCAAMALGSCRYNDSDIWGAVNKQEERISALEKWRGSVEKQLNALQGILTATDYVTGVEKVVKDGKNGYKLSFLHAEPITLYYNNMNEVSGSSDAQSIGVAQDDKGYYWTLGKDPLLVDGKRVYVKGGDMPTLKPNPQNAELFDLMIGDTKVTIDPRVAGSVAIKGIEERDGKVIVTLNDNTSKELVKFVDVKALIQNEYVHNMAGEKVYPVSLPEGFMMSLVGAVPNGWSVEIEGAGPETKIKVVYPAQNAEVKLTFVVFVDGVSSSAYKVVTFKVSADAPPAVVWTPIIFDGSTDIVIPEGSEHFKVTNAAPVGPPVFSSKVCTPLKNSPNAKHIDLSEYKHSAAIPTNAFFMNGNPNVPEDSSNFNDVIETIILPRNNGVVWSKAFKNCRALKSVTFTVAPTNIHGEVFEGCTALESIFVPAEHVEAAKGLAGFASVKDKIKAIPQ